MKGSERLPALTARERGLLRSLLPLLPERIIDAHTHCNLLEHVGAIPPPLDSLPMTTFAAYDLSEAEVSRGELWPGKHVRALRFANAFQGIDHRAANDYLAASAPHQGDWFVAFGISDDPDYTVGLLRRTRATACKMYARSVVPFLTRITEVFPPAVLAECARLEVPIILHLPASLEESREELLTVLDDYPTLKVVLAHCALVRPDHQGDLDALLTLAPHANVVVDTALVVDPRTLDVALQALGPERVLFGTDEPLSLLRVLEYQHPVKGKQWASTTPYHWLDMADYVGGDLKDRELLLFVQQIKAIVDVAVLHSADQGRVERLLCGIFHDNAARFFRIR
ncbi:amidohydrolase family protein [Terracoccus luteus]|uniref:Putative TIM-barrel fold metal-dependent hydrolase n=1 Tax=Terracoccus luteus TaxID=53356 RepID=A0A839Q2G5_9MICO|nr:amidohydrolase family protein [Terracoccus luteus]MBB2988525.1 putative TIM-barrel fold metal-dependent hydrolase [Terracoccus luteus]MCP2174175.1 putative TIM-barrel fold metal-dependent hydrolase [Terracoccus luteus]